MYCTVEPCLMCLGAVLHARIDRLVFGAADAKVGGTEMIEVLRQHGAEFNHRFTCRGGVLAAEAGELLIEFFRKRRGSTASQEEHS